ncbi:hypothetical protein DIS18_04370 [Algibacter marinivivus]|uniref:CAAX prenyl protease 2/Lysostaphin resistance protein A-like domain-containing protein n=1 Tax=Algibacter marinivivus TaxID=2100723 RepID=A0A2U2X7R6_9FLAO|nr:CPBP family intramembrane glutamic endopeptidase [Algibacter marinivivus]PWH83793.1 hypothetical protein DIS18_04370 [Algibacter marinivivus]
MKSLLRKYPVISRYILAILLLGLALVLSGIIDNPFLKKYFPFASSLFLLIATWFLYKTDGKTLSTIGLNLKWKNIRFLPLGVFIGATVFLIAKYLRALYTGEIFAISTSISYSTILYGLYTILPTVAVEEFLFRGYLFKKTISVSNVIVANIIFSIVFMLVHVLDANILQNRAMVIFFVITIPIGHLLFAIALLKSKTLFFPIGIHLGNNWATRHLITNSDSGESFLYILNNVTFDTWWFYIGFIVLWNAFFLVVVLFIWKWDRYNLFTNKKVIN